MLAIGRVVRTAGSSLLPIRSALRLLPRASVAAMRDIHGSPSTANRSGPTMKEVKRETVTGLQKNSSDAPFMAKALGYSGLIPFAVTAGLACSSYELDVAVLAMQAQLAYGASVLSFLGGVHWGLAGARYTTIPLESVPERRKTLMESEPPKNDEERDKALVNQFEISVIPALWGAGSLMLGGKPGLAALACGFGLMAVYDLKQVADGLAPAWYRKLRIPLTAAVVLAIGATVAMGPGQNAEEERKRELAELQKRFNLPPPEAVRGSSATVSSGPGSDSRDK